MGIVFVTWSEGSGWLMHAPTPHLNMDFAVGSCRVQKENIHLFTQVILLLFFGGELLAYVKPARLLNMVQPLPIGHLFSWFLSKTRLSRTLASHGRADPPT